MPSTSASAADCVGLSPSSFNTRRVGLGLMLEHDSSTTPDLMQHDLNSTPSTSGVSSTRSSLDSADSFGLGQRRALTAAARPHWTKDSRAAADSDTTFTLSPTGPVDAFSLSLSSSSSTTTRARTPAALSSATCAAAVSPTIASRRGADAQQLARSPLLAPSVAATPNAANNALSPRLAAPSSITRSPSPSHGVYNLSSSSASNRTPMTTPTRPTSFIGNIVGSVAMDRQSSASKSRDVHNRHQSLTSACPPVTSSFNSPATSGQSPPEKQNGGLRMKRSGSSGNSPKRSDAAWLWSRAGRDSAPSSARNSDDDEDPREGAKAHLTGPPPSKLDSLLSLPSNLLALFLAPLTNHGAPPPAFAPSPALNGTPSLGGGPNSSIAKSPKRYPLALRIVVLSYLVFSVFSFGLHLQGIVTGKDDTRFGVRSKSDVGLSSRIEPRATSSSSQEQHVIGQATEQVNAGTMFPLGSMRRVRLGHWAHKVAEGVRWGRGSVQAEEEAALELLRKEVDGDNLDEPAEGMAEWGIVRRMSGNQDIERSADSNPLTPFTHTYRFSKMHDKLHWDFHDEIVPFAFSASAAPAPNDVTACLYSNEAWLSTLGSFVAAWQGPVSLVFETAHSRTSDERVDLMRQIQAIREADELVRRHVDIHIVGSPNSTKERARDKLRERMIEQPLAQNYQINLARFFAPTDVIFVVADPRVVPSAGLKSRLADETIRQVVIERGDVVAVPTFGFIRDPTGDTSETKFPSLDDLRIRAGLNEVENAPVGVSAAEFEVLASQHILALHESLPLPPSAWPSRKQSLVSQVSTRRPTPEVPTTARIAMFDRRWDVNHGPSNWYLWRKQATDKHLEDEPELGGGVGLGLDGSIGGGRDLYKVVDYDMHYSPALVMSRKGQPWCTERFETMHAACTYQMYLTGAEVWVLPDEWTYTLERIEPKHDGWEEDPADRLKNSISARLFGKFHQEACMHYGREFLSMQMWDSEKAQHLRETCVRTLNTWGMGLAPSATTTTSSSRSKQ
ncbi:hypothetical protein ACM66B_004027 [Microbotryomycetes sp. NB124-2]